MIYRRPVEQLIRLSRSTPPIKQYQKGAFHRQSAGANELLVGFNQILKIGFKPKIKEVIASNRIL